MMGFEVRPVRRKDGDKTTAVGDTVYILNEAGKGLVKGAIAIMAAYIVLDTARQVTVDAAHHKVYFEEKPDA